MWAMQLAVVAALCDNRAKRESNQYVFFCTYKSISMRIRLVSGKAQVYDRD
ncbi:hypothetical protein YC2023_048091 [Brassica napus]